MIPDHDRSSRDDEGGYRLLKVLSPDRTFLCEDVVGNKVVLKQMEEDCLPGQKLHPQIRDRLARVRELAHPRVATLRTVERWNGTACLVWTYLDGNAFDDCTAMSLPTMISLVGAVDALHQTGITHGNIHGRNIILTPNDQVWLTDVSPYLYADPFVDVEAVKDLLAIAAERLPADQAAAVRALLSHAQSLKELSVGILAITAGPPDVAPAISIAPAGYRMTSLLTAAVVAALGFGCWLTLHASLSKTAPSAPAAFPSLRR